MTDTKASAMPLATALTGAEGWAGYQGGQDRRFNPALVKRYTLPGAPAVGVRLALSPTQLQALLDALPADQTNEVTVRWTSAARVRTGDALYTFIQSTLSLSGGAMTDLMNNAATYD